MKDLKILAVGCSMTQGHGLDHEQDDPRLWTNAIFESFGKVKNIAKSARNNHWIFLETLTEITKNYYDIVLVAWSATPRFNIHAGLELYPVLTRLDRSVDVDVNPGVTYKARWLDQLGDTLRRIQNDHWDILDLVKYVNVLIHYQQTIGGKIFFVNTLSPWSLGYFNQKKFTLPTDLTVYEQNLLQAETRDDAEVLDLYNMIHSQYSQAGGIQESHWLNLYQSLKSMQIDHVSESDRHPGYMSQKEYIEYLSPILKTKMEQN